MTNYNFSIDYVFLHNIKMKIMNRTISFRNFSLLFNYSFYYCKGRKKEVIRYFVMLPFFLKKPFTSYLFLCLLDKYCYSLYVIYNIGGVKFVFCGSIKNIISEPIVSFITTLVVTSTAWNCLLVI